MVVIDFIDMVLESNRDLVLRRLTEALGRDRTRHQVSEVTSLGLVQLTRKRLGTGLIEAFSTTCPHCGGRGIMLHADPVDSAPATGRKSESGGKRGRRSKKGKPDEPEVAKVPAHSPGEHPMFKAMAAVNGSHDDDTDDTDESAPTEDADEAVGEQDREDAEADGQIQEQVAREAAEEDLDDGDFEDTDEEDDEVDLDEDEDEDDEDLDDEDLDDDDDEDDEDEDEDEDLDLDDDLHVDDSDDSDDSDSPTQATHAAGKSDVSVLTAPAAQSRRRRAAARPAGPPDHED
jgi:ribonuclease E